MIKFVTVCTLLSVALHVLPLPSTIDSCARINTVGISARLCLSGLHFDGNVSFDGISDDYGNMERSRPGAILYPSSTSDIATLLKAVNSGVEGCQGLKVAARGNGHSIHGQAQVPDGHIVVEMRALSQSYPIHVTKNKHGGSPSYADVSGGHLWSEVLLAAAKEKLSPVSWTDFLELTVGGTLSNAGVSGQTSRYGPQISNVLSLQVVTGKGEVEVCSGQKNPELFKAVLGGLGQFGIITSARIRLQKAPSRVTWIRSLYDDVGKFTKDQESLISRNDVAGVDYVEGFVVARNDKDPINGWRSVLPEALVDVLLLHTDHLLSSTVPILYCLETAKYHYDDDDDGQINEHNKMDSFVSSLGHIPSLVFAEDIAYPDFLSRVKLEEEIKDEFGNEVKVPHPWINLFVPSSSILDFDSVVFKHYLKDGVGGPIILYPLNLNKWDNEMSAVVPNHEVFYMVAILRSASFESPSVQEIMQQNKEILNFSLGSRIGAKQYLAYNENEEEWKRHYGSKWSSILRRKAVFDPLHILSPGQKVFFKQFDTF